VDQSAPPLCRTPPLLAPPPASRPRAVRPSDRMPVGCGPVHTPPRPTAGPSPVLAKMGQLQRLFMSQAAVADAWAIANKEDERRAVESKPASSPPGGSSSPQVGPRLGPGGSSIEDYLPLTTNIVFFPRQSLTPSSPPSSSET